jgi:23S rRNA-/tRNA-specific pseudouridylate synthase
MSKIRLHKYLKDLVQETGLEFTAPEIQRNIETYGAQIDGEMIFKRLEWVIPSQEVSIDHWPEREKGNFEEVEVLERNDDFMVVFKPYNVVVQPGAGHQNNNLQSWLQTQFTDQYWLPVHRLDKNTQGILLFANGEQNQKFFQNQFRNRSVKKRYLALVDNIVDNLWNVRANQIRAERNLLRQRIVLDLEEHPEAREARSTFKPLVVSLETRQTLVEVEIFTGRMHQIRLHAEAIGFPLSNDQVYHGAVLSSQQLDTVAQEVFSFQKPQSLDKQRFRALTKQVFKDQEYGLLSNCLEFDDKNGARRVFERISVNDLLR